MVRMMRSIVHAVRLVNSKQILRKMLILDVVFSATGFDHCSEILLLPLCASPQRSLHFFQGLPKSMSSKPSRLGGEAAFEDAVDFEDACPGCSFCRCS